MEIKPVVLTVNGNNVDFNAIGAQIAAAIAAALGQTVAAPTPAPAPEPEPVEEELPDFEFGEILSTDEDEDSFTRVYSVVGAAELNVVVTPEGVKVDGLRYEENEEDDSTFDDTFAPNGAYDEVTADYDEDEATLTVTLVKVPDEGRPVEISGW